MGMEGVGRPWKVLDGFGRCWTGAEGVEWSRELLEDHRGSWEVAEDCL